MIYESKLFYTTKEMAEILKVSSVTIFKRIKNGKINAEKIGKNYLIPRSELSRFGVKIEDETRNVPEVPEAKTLAKEISEDFRNTVFLRDGKTIVTKHEDFFKTR